MTQPHSAPGAAPSIPRRERAGARPLSFAQERLWFFDQLEPRSALYNIGRAIELRGRLDPSALRRALEAVVARHDALRTTIQAVEGRPVQRVDPACPIDLPLVDLEDGAHPGREALPALLAEEARRPFDLSRDMMLRAILFRVHAEEHVLVLTVHHIASDGWSLGLLFRELSEAYTACVAGRPPTFPDLPIQYADYAQWQREWLRGPTLERELVYWQGQLAGLTPLELPTDRPRPARQTYRGAREPFRLSAEFTAALKALGRPERVTLFMTLLAAFQTLLHRYSRRDDIAVGSPIAGRGHTQLEGLIGFFVNTLVLRTDLSGNPTFRELLSRVREVALGAYAHQSLPFEQLVGELQPTRTLSHAPLFQVMLAFDNTPTVPLAFPGLVARASELDTGTAKCDLILSLQETPDGLTGSMEYSTDLFDAATIRLMLGHWETLLAGIVVDPGQTLSALPLLTEPERRQILVEWNATGRDYPAGRCIHELFEAQAVETPSGVALTFEDESLSYDKLDRRANQLAHHLRALGIGPETPVGICVERSLEMIVGLLGILKAGGVYVPLDPAYPRQRLQFMLEDAGANVLLTQERLLASLPERCASVVRLDADGPAISRESDTRPANRTTPENLAYVMYTSGSTGQPKGVMVPHRAVVRLVKNTNYVHLSANEVFLQLAPLGFDASTFEIWGSLLNGARLAIYPPEAPSVPGLGEALRRHQVTTLWLTAAFFHQVVEHDVESLGQVRQLLAGGDVLSVPHVRRMLRERPGCRLINGYGPTEATTFACTFLVRSPDELGPSVPIGRPIANTRVYVLGPCREPVPVGVPGELFIGGDGLARGYLNSPELTADRFVPDPFVDRPEARLYRTGDLARYRADGNLEFLGRVDHQVKIRGFRVEPGEVEAALGQHPAVRAVAVVAREETPGNKYLVAYVEARGEPRPSPDGLREYLAERLPAYMIPAAFVSIVALPLTPSGKVDRGALPAPLLSDRTSEPGSVGPRDAVEAQLVKIWEDVLHVRPIGVRHDFFQLGGHSLLATRLLARIEQSFGKRIPLAALFLAPTVEQLAAALRDERPSESWPRVVPIQAEGRRPPFFCVGAGPLFRPLAQRLGLDQPFLGLSLDAGALATPFTLEDIAAYHVKTVRTAQPSGPYIVGGWSANGVIAYEMAQQMRTAREDVVLVVLFDAVSPSQLEPPSGRGATRIRLGLRKQALAFHWSRLRQGGLRDAPGYVRARLETMRDNLEQAAWRLRYTSRVRMGKPIEGSLRDADQIVLYTFRAYRPRPYEGRVVLFRRRERPSGSFWDPAAAWREVIGDRLEIREIPGDHVTIFSEPNVDILARELRLCLDTALGAGEDSRAGTLG